LNLVRQLQIPFSTVGPVTQPETRSSAQTLASGVQGLLGDRHRRKGEQHESVLDRSKGLWGGVATILWIIAAICVIGGIVTLILGAVLSASS
jgi:hypothetical protein